MRWQVGRCNLAVDAIWVAAIWVGKTQMGDETGLGQDVRVKSLALELSRHADERQCIANRAMGVPLQNALAMPCAVGKEMLICIGWV